MTSLTAILEAPAAARPSITPPRRALPLPFTREARALDLARVTTDVAARRLASAFLSALARGAVIASGEQLGEAVETYTAAIAEERRLADAMRSPPSYTNSTEIPL